MTPESASSRKGLLPAWPPDAESYYRPALVVSMVASAGMAIGSVGTWASVIVFSVGGLDFENWGVATLIFGVISLLAVLAVTFWLHIPIDLRWAVVVGWGIAVIGVTCITDAVINIAKLMTLPKTSFFGVPIGVSPGWGLWLVALSSMVLIAGGVVIAIQMTRSYHLHRPLSQAAGSWTARCRGAAIISSSAIVIAGTIYAVIAPWKGDSADGASLNAQMPSYSGFSSSANSPSATPSTTSARPVPHVVDAPPLDGTYRQDIDAANITTDGKIDPRRDTDPIWFAFRSTCTVAGCVASGSYLDPHKLGLPLQQSSTALALHWISDHWQYSNTRQSYCSGPNGDAQEEVSNVWSFTSHPDGFYRGTATTTTLSDECSNDGAVRVEPFTLTRTGPPPPGAIDPPIAVIGQPPALPPPARHPAPNPGAAVSLGGQELTVSTRVPLCVWTHGKAGIIVYAPDRDESLAQVEDLTTSGQVKRVSIQFGDLLYWFDDWTRTNQIPNASVSVTRKGRKSYSVAGVAAAWYRPTATFLVKTYEINVTCP